MDKKALEYMFVSAINQSLKHLEGTDLLDKFRVFCDVGVYKDAVVFYPKGSRAKTPVCAVLHTDSVIYPADATIQSIHMRGGSISILEAGHVSVAR